MDLQELNKKKAEAEAAINKIIEELLDETNIGRCFVDVAITEHFESGGNNIARIVKTKIKIVI